MGRVVVAAMVLCLLTRGVWGQNLELIPHAPGRGVSIWALSEDGTRGTGTDGGTFSEIPFRWSRARGRADVQTPTGITSWNLPFLSRDGDIAFGGGYGPGQTGLVATRQQASSPATTLGRAISTYENTRVLGVFGNGEGFVGGAGHYISSAGFEVGEPIMWTQSGGYRRLGTVPGSRYAQAEAVSEDGRVLVGFGNGSEGVAFRWTEATGYQMLPAFPGGSFNDRAAHAVTDDGNSIFGWATGPVGAGSGAVRWDSLGNIASLDPTYRFAVSSAEGATGDGSFVWGSGRAQGSSGINDPWLWTASNGMMPVEDYLGQFGVHFPAGDHVLYLRAVSDNGLVFAGSMASGDGFIAIIPTPSALAPLLLCGMFGWSRRRSFSHSCKIAAC